MRRARDLFCLGGVVMALMGCATASSTLPPRGPKSGEQDAAQVTALADQYVREYFEFSPVDATFFGVPTPRHDDRWNDNSLEALARWRAEEDRLLAQLVTINPARLSGRPEWVTYGVLREQLEASVASRVCHEELWFTRSDIGLAMMLTNLPVAQPTGSPEANQRTVARWKDLGRLLDVEIVNLKKGLEAGYFGEKNNVRRLIAAMDVLLDGPVEKSPFYDPARRAADANFGRTLAEVISTEVRPAIKRYRDFLATSYLPRAREQPSVTATPGGVACYRAFLRQGTSMALEPEEIHRTGLEQLAKLEQEERMIAKRGFQTEDLPSLFERLRTEKEFLLDREGRLRCGRESVARAKQVALRVFDLVPKADLEAREAEPGIGSSYLVSPAPGRPAIYWVGDDTEPRLLCETIAFHEGIPGHHLQIAVALERGNGVHPIARYFLNTAFSEGWALYAERLADELGLLDQDLFRLGMLEEQAFRAARLVVDTGLHAKGWSRQQAIDYMLAHTAERTKTVEEEIDRYIGDPGQATGYMIGMLEIRRLRSEAESKLGPRFDLKQFHDRVLEDGNLTLPMLRAKIERWLAAPGASPHSPG
jgi:uncharacterized protein (DUF885 family)